MGGQGQPKWDIYEAVILLDSFIKIEKGEDKQYEIQKISRELRQLAVNRNIEIDEVYRNINGITLQMLRMKDTFIGKNDNGRASKLFVQVVTLYRENILEYNRVLKEAKNLISSGNNSNISSSPSIEQQVLSKNQVLFVNFDCIDDLINVKPIALYYKDYVLTNIDSWYDMYIELKNILGKIIPGVLRFDCSIDNNEESLPSDILFAIKNIYKFFNLDITELSITYAKMIGSGNSKEIVTEEINKNDESISQKNKLKDRCITILNSDFEDGFILGNYMHKMRFLSSYEENYGSDISNEISDIDEYLSGFGRIVDDRVYAPSDVSNSKVLDNIFDSVLSAFNNSASVISAECLFERYGRELAAEMNIYSAETLFSVLASEKRFTDSYSLKNMNISNLNCEFSLNDEVKKRLKNSSHPITAAELHQIMWYISVEKLKTVLRQLPEAVRVDASAYFYGPNFYISSDEKTVLIKQMYSEIYSKGYITTKKLREIFKNSCPSAAMDSGNFKDYGIRELLKYTLDDKFEFNNSVITENGTNLDLRQVFRDFASEHEKLTLSEIKEFQEEVGLGSLSTTYWNAMLDEAIRISDTELVRKDLINFDVKSIDEVLDMICTGSYMALKDIDLFLSFPAIQYRWNGFVLESYLKNYSEKFCLLQVSTSADTYNGVMVRKNSEFETYEDVAADLLAKNNEWTNEEGALKVLSNSGFQQRAKNKNIIAIIKKAKAIRENVNS